MRHLFWSEGSGCSAPVSLQVRRWNSLLDNSSARIQTWCALMWLMCPLSNTAGKSGRRRSRRSWGVGGVGVGGGGDPTAGWCNRLSDSSSGGDDGVKDSSLHWDWKTELKLTNVPLRLDGSRFGQFSLNSFDTGGILQPSNPKDCVTCIRNNESWWEIVENL